jgi:asparagine synthase (glutamine-hydrolysing)
MQSRDLAPRPVDEYVDEYASLMEGAVHRQLMSNVPIGVFLSGGLDSSIIAALAAKWNKDIRCFHIHDRADQTGDTAAAEELVAAEGLELTRVSLADRRFLNLTLEDLEYLVWTLGAPGVNAVTLSKLATYGQVRLVEPQMKVVIIGAGADEFAGGYSKDTGDPYGKTYPNWEAFHRGHVNFAPEVRVAFPRRLCPG